MVELDGNLRVHDAIRAGAVHVGSERAPLLVVDNFLSDPQLLIDYAANLGRFAPETETKYPRVRALLPEIYSLAVLHYLSPTARGGTGFYRPTANLFLRFAG